MAFGSELVLMVGLGFVVLGPKRMHALLGQVARVRSELEKASRGLKSQLSTELHESGDAEPPGHTAAEAATCHERAALSHLEKNAPAPQLPEQEPAEQQCSH